jgi:hypothetical protein
MKLITGFTLLLIFIGLSGCLNVFQPLITPDIYVRDGRIEGDWNVGGFKINITEYSRSVLANQKIMEFTHTDKSTDKAVRDSINIYHKSYILSFSDGAYSYFFGMQMTLIGKSYYVQMSPLLYTHAPLNEKILNEKNVPESRFNAFGSTEVMSMYSFGRLTFTDNNQVHLQFFDGDKIKGLILKGQLKTSYAFDSLYDNFLVTANTDELNKFITKYGNDEELFSKQNSFQLIKVK